MFSAPFASSSWVNAHHPSTLYECSACCSEKPQAQFVKIEGYPVCHECVRDIFRYAIEDESNFPPMWGSEQLDVNHYRGHVLSADICRAFESKSEEYLIPYQERVYCYRCNSGPKPRKMFLGRRASEDQNYKHCPDCDAVHCMRCGNGLGESPPHMCEKDIPDPAFQGLKKGLDYQICPGCSIKVQLRDGCNHVVCLCRREFCFVCGQPARGSSNHWVRGGCPRYNHPDNFNAMWEEHLFHEIDAGGANTGPLWHPFNPERWLHRHRGAARPTPTQPRATTQAPPAQVQQVGPRPQSDVLANMLRAASIAPEPTHSLSRGWANRTSSQAHVPRQRATTDYQPYFLPPLQTGALDQVANHGPQPLQPPNMPPAASAEMRSMPAASASLRPGADQVPRHTRGNGGPELIPRRAERIRSRPSMLVGGRTTRASAAPAHSRNRRISPANADGDSNLVIVDENARLPGHEFPPTGPSFRHLRRDAVDLRVSHSNDTEADLPQRVRQAARDFEMMQESFSREHR